MYVVVTDAPRKGRGNTRHVYGFYRTRSAAIAAIGKSKRADPELWIGVDYTVHKVILNTEGATNWEEL